MSNQLLMEHYPECWRDDHGCAIEEIKRLAADCANLKADLRDMDETANYWRQKAVQLGAEVDRLRAALARAKLDLKYAMDSSENGLTRRENVWRVHADITEALR
jgi:multidrug resistance efflux pump